MTKYDTSVAGKCIDTRVTRNGESPFRLRDYVCAISTNRL